MSVHPEPEAGSPEQQAASWLVLLEDNPADDALRDRWQRWLRADKRHARAWERMERVWAVAGGQAGASATERRKSAFPHRRALTAGLAMAASLLLGIGLLVSDPQRKPEVYESDVARRVIRLEDGSLLTLDADTRLRVAMAPGLRSVELQKGQAMFDITRDRSRPFQVDANGLSILVHGTVFNVDVSRGGKVAVTLLEGSVSVTLREASQITQKMSVPGQRVSWSAESDSVRTEEEDPAVVAAWSEGRLIFRGEPLAEALARFNRYQQAPVPLPAHLDAALPVYGVFRSDDVYGLLNALNDD